MINLESSVCHLEEELKLVLRYAFNDNSRINLCIS